MNRLLLVVTLSITAILLVVGTFTTEGGAHDNGTPDGAVRSMFAAVQAGDWQSAYRYIANQNAMPLQDFIRDLNGNNGDLRSFSKLSKVTPKVMRQSDQDALVHADLLWS